MAEAEVMAGPGAEAPRAWAYWDDAARVAWLREAGAWLIYSALTAAWEVRTDGRLLATGVSPRAAIDAAAGRGPDGAGDFHTLDGGLLPWDRNACRCQ